MSAERPRRSEPLGASGGAAGEGTAPAPGGRLREGARYERRNLHHRRPRGLWEVSRGRPGRASARRYNLPLFANAKEEAPGPRVVFERSDKTILGGAKGHAGPESPRREPRAAQRARRASRVSGCEQKSRRGAQGSGKWSVPCGRRTGSRCPKAAARRAKERGPCGPLGEVSARTGCRRRTGRLRAREPSRPRPQTCGRA